MTSGSHAVRIVVAGKGGVGKTTLTATLARLLARAGRSVLAVDADAQCNLARTLGLAPRGVDAIVPLSHNHDYVAETTGGAGALVRLNPDVSDVLDRYALAAPDGVRLLVMGGLVQAGGGCLCPETALLAATVAAVGRDSADVVIVDTQAGVEHFGRALARGFDHALVVADPTSNAGDVAVQAARLAHELGLTRVDLVLNRSRSGCRPGWLDDAAVHFDTVSELPHEDLVRETEPSVDAVVATPTPFRAAVTGLAAGLLAGSRGTLR